MKNRIQYFQMLRAVGMTLIFFSHCDYLVQVNNKNALAYLGCAGVSIFISLSGFLTRLKYEKKGLKTLAVFRGRWKQFYKMHFITLLLSVPLCISELFISPAKWWGKLFINAFLVQTLIPKMSVYYSFNLVSWFLSLMIIFSLLTPIAVYVWDRLSTKKVMLVTIVLFFIEIIFVLVLGNCGFSHWFLYVFPLSRFIEFINAGAWYSIAVKVKEKKLFRINIIMLFIFSAIFFALLVWSCFEGNDFFLTSIWTVPSIVIVSSLYCLNVQPKNNWIYTVLVRYGDVTFDFFLLHQLIIRYLTRISLHYGFVLKPMYFIAFVLSLVFSILLKILNEKTISKNLILK